MSQGETVQIKFEKARVLVFGQSGQIALTLAQAEMLAKAILVKLDRGALK